MYEGKLLQEHQECRPVRHQSFTDKLTLFKSGGQIIPTFIIFDHIGGARRPCFIMTKAMQRRHSKAANSLSTKEAPSIEYSSFFHSPQFTTQICAMASVK